MPFYVVLAWTTVVIQIFGSKTYFVVPVYGKGVNAKIQEIAFVPQFSAYTLIEQGRKVKGLLFPITEMYHQRIAIQIFSLPYCQNFIHSHSF